MRGTKRSTIFCTMSFPKGRCISTPLCSETKLDTNSMITGIVNIVTMLLIAVNVTDKATSPFANIENTLEELPPGQQAMSIMPIKYTGGNFRSKAKINAIIGNNTNWPVIPTTTARGLRATFVNDSLFKSVPNKNIRTIRMGITIQIMLKVNRLVNESISLLT